MELYFLALLVVLMAIALASGFPVAFALPGSAIVTILVAAGFGLAFEGDSHAFFANDGPKQWLSAGVTNFRGIYWEAERDTLIAIPLFIFMGIMLQRSKIAEDLLVTMAQLFGPIPGGLGISVVFVGALLAATTGILGATVVAMGLISLPAMQRNGYSNALSTGTISASGTLGQIIPPSIVLIILADQLASASDQAATARSNLYKASTGEFAMPSEFAVSSTSAGDMFMGALGPGLVLVGLYMAFILTVALIRPSFAPAVPYEGKMDRAFFGRVFLILVPPLALIFAVLGSIIAGIATVNQAGAIGAVGATIMAGYRLTSGQRGAFIPAILAILSLLALAWILSVYDINVKNIQTEADETGLTLASIAVGVLVVAVVWSLWRAWRIDDTLNGVMLDTAKTTSLVFIILLGAAMLTAAFRAFGGEELVKDFLGSLPGGFWTQFIIVMVVIFLLGFFLDFIEIAVVVVPIVAPILLMDPGANITAVWLGVMIGLNIQTSFLTPPFGFALFYLRGVAPRSVKTTQMYKGVVPFIMLQLVALGIVGNYEPLVNYLPTRISLTASTAPPPSNPRLAYCLDSYLREEFDERGEDIRAEIERARGLDLAVLPEDHREDLEEAFQEAQAVFGYLEELDEAEAAVEAATPEYRPLHEEVRRIQRDIRDHQEDIEEVQDSLDEFRFAEDQSPERKAALEARLERLNRELEELRGAIPEDWEPRHETFLELQQAELNARRAYRRASNDGYEPVLEMIAILEATDSVAALEPRIEEAAARLGEASAEDLEEQLSDILSAARDAEAGDDLTDALSDARRAVRDDEPDLDAARENLGLAREALAAELAWKRAAIERVLPGLERYRDRLAGTIGIRTLERLPREHALYIASCEAQHRDISLLF
jgi:TRAP-type mannitol/chloroaromatic compound transport system permease large subunit/ribosome-binding protein aMBF1 (putative translation factor)